MPTIATPEGVSAPDVVVPSDQLSGSAELVFGDNASKVTIRGGAGIDGLLEAHFEGNPPEVRADGGRVHVGSTPLSIRSRPSEFVLNPSVPWSIVINGGVSDLTVLLDGVELTGFKVGGLSKADLTLGTPSAETRVTFGAVSHLKITRPANVPVRVEASGGLTKLTLDDEYFGAVGGGLNTETSDYKSATGRYLVSFSSGSDITVTGK